MRMLLRFGFVLAAVAVTTVVVVSLSARETSESESEREEKRFEVRVTDEMRRHSRIGDTLYFVGTAWSFGVLALVLFSGLSRRMRDVAARVTRKPFVIAMLYIALFTIVIAILEFPLSYYAGLDRKSTRLNSSHGYISYAVFCLKKKNR